MLAAIGQVWVLVTSEALPTFCRTRKNTSDPQGAEGGGGR